MDAYAKTVLTVIAACLMLQVAQGFGLVGTPEPEPVVSSNAEAANRYQFQPIPMVRQLFRFDRSTGQTWTMPLQPQKVRFWKPVDEFTPQLEEAAEAENAPSPSEEAAEQGNQPAGVRGGRQGNQLR
jgi:hypothetical protein